MALVFIRLHLRIAIFPGRDVRRILRIAFRVRHSSQLQPPTLRDQGLLQPVNTIDAQILRALERVSRRQRAVVEDRARKPGIRLEGSAKGLRLHLQPRTAIDPVVQAPTRGCACGSDGEAAARMFAALP